MLAMDEHSELASVLGPLTGDSSRVVASVAGAACGGRSMTALTLCDRARAYAAPARAIGAEIGPSDRS